MKTFPVLEHAADVVRTWAAELAAVTGIDEARLRSDPRCLHFPNQTVRIVLVDGSEVNFHYARFLVDLERATIVVVTEHCGHHTFPFHEAQVFLDGELAWSHGG